MRRSYTTVTWLELPQMWFSYKELPPQPLRTCWQECFAGAGQPSDTTLARHLFWTLLTCTSSPKKQATWTFLVPQWFLWLSFCEKRCRWAVSKKALHVYLEKQARNRIRREGHESQILFIDMINHCWQHLKNKGSWKQRSSYLLNLITKITPSTKSDFSSKIYPL